MKGNLLTWLAGFLIFLQLLFLVWLWSRIIEDYFFDFTSPAWLVGLGFSAAVFLEIRAFKRKNYRFIFIYGLLLFLLICWWISGLTKAIMMMA